MRYFFLFLISLCFSILEAQTIRQVESGYKSSIRAVSVVNPSIVWLSGSNGNFARSTDGGKSWKWTQLKQYKSNDFRGIKAFSAKRAVLMSSGTPGLILFTEDGGLNWTEAYRNDSKDIFLDGISFYNDRDGLAYGDPIMGKMQLLRTSDGGKTWLNISENLKIKLADGEASFAASNTGITTHRDGRTWIITGGSQSRVFYSADKGGHWEVSVCPVIQGGESRGPFSVAFYAHKHGIVVGGDYKIDTLRNKNLVLTQDGGRTWKEPLIRPWGFRSCVVYMNARLLIATGTSGTDLSQDGGFTWTNISKDGYHVVAALKDGKTAILAGGDGRIALLDL
ncbi:oxidoreductase [Arcticibacter tournemirensis]|uniref:Oxidoreductase n=1 Tax=Arcticibacter tournemirensis TaxID=699437 RepID=A0A4Q0MAA5_9SPHI|nr:oxidoreductase [Arcticibacter tournemirensis]